MTFIDSTATPTVVSAKVYPSYLSWRTSLESRASAILFKREREGFAVIVSIREITAWVVLSFLAKALCDIFFAVLFSMSFLASKYSVSDSSHSFLNSGSFSLSFRSSSSVYMRLITIE